MRYGRRFYTHFLWPGTAEKIINVIKPHFGITLGNVITELLVHVLIAMTFSLFQ